MDGEPPDRAPSKGKTWISWLLGAGLVLGVVAASRHFTEQRDFVRLLERAEPWWLWVAVGLQLGTYFAQGAVFRLVARATGRNLSRRDAFELSLARLFADQTLPSAGVSSSVLVARALTERRFAPGAVRASVLINVASYHAAYVAALLAALAILAGRGQLSGLIALPSAAFLAFSIAVSGAILSLTGRRHDGVARTIGRWPAVGAALEYISGAEPQLVRNPRVFAAAAAQQTGMMVLDAATLWTLIRAVGSDAPVAAVFAAFMVASLFRTIGVVPGGLGTFEASCVLMLRAVGLDTAAALASTLLFRGLSFWLPMAPGYWCARRAIAPRP